MASLTGEQSQKLPSKNNSRRLSESRRHVAFALVSYMLISYVNAASLVSLNFKSMSMQN